MTSAGNMTINDEFERIKKETALEFVLLSVARLCLGNRTPDRLN
jgi:hypothetical protein